MPSVPNAAEKTVDESIDMITRVRCTAENVIDKLSQGGWSNLTIQKVQEVLSNDACHMPTDDDFEVRDVDSEVEMDFL